MLSELNVVYGIQGDNCTHTYVYTYNPCCTVALLQPFKAGDSHAGVNDASSITEVKLLFFYYRT